jgi:hypothetical protein
MASDDEWVSNVKRWCLEQKAVREQAVSAPSEGFDAPFDPDQLGYEAAHPALQARHWPDASATF